MDTSSDKSVMASSRPPATVNFAGVRLFRSNRLRTRLTVRLLWAHALLLLIGSASITVSGKTFRLFDTTLIQLLLAPVTLTLFCMWMYRAYDNLIPLGARGVKRTPPSGRMPLVYVPFAYAVLPVQALAEIVRSSDPSFEALQPGSSGSGMTSLGWAWATFVNAILLSIASQRFAKGHIIRIPPTTIEDFVSFFSFLLWLQFLIALIFLVSRTNKRQERRDLMLCIYNLNNPFVAVGAGGD
jgi:Domain of unknown function (DUF4328)